MFLSLGAASRMVLDSSFDAVIVGIRTDDDRTVVIEPLNPGATNLVFVDTRRRVIANIRILVCASFGSTPAIPPGSFKCGQQAISTLVALIAYADEVID